ncbi:MAG: hypothetical protein HRT88_15390, partial [Lentisphaeraceae bacterium]|nr:hypothetical protein [Lentisphaeraceae bacterium]
MINERHIHRLLLQREREFTAVWRVECEVNKILGGDFPFGNSPDLPSSQKLAKKKAVARKRSQRLPKINTLIRPLQQQENAFKVSYSCGTDVFESIHADIALIRQLMPLQTDSFTVLKVETVQLGLKGECQIIEELWDKN